MTSHANRGKFAEGEVQKWLNRLNSDIAAFAWLRLPDARSAMGRMKAMPSDFIVFSPKGTTFLEVKEIEHDFRVPKDKIPQVTVLKKMQMAGCRACVLVFFKTIKKWRCMDISEVPIIERGSWDFRDHPTFDTCEAAFINKYEV